MLQHNNESHRDAETKTGIEKGFKGIWRFWVLIPALLCLRSWSVGGCVIDRWLILWPSEGWDWLWLPEMFYHHRRRRKRHNYGCWWEDTLLFCYQESLLCLLFHGSEDKCCDSLSPSASADTETKEWLELLLRIMKVSEWLSPLKALQCGLRLNQWNSYALIRNGCRNVGFGSRTVKWFILTLHKADRSSSVWDWNSKHPSAFSMIPADRKNNPFNLWKQCPGTKLVWVSIAELMTWADTQRNMQWTLEE